MGKGLKRAGRLLGTVAAGGAGLGLGCIARTWLSYGRSKYDRSPDFLLDRFMPSYEIAERHETVVHAPASVTYAAARALDLHRSAVIQAIFAGRELFMRSKPVPRPKSGSFLTEVLELGWGVLA